MKRTTIIMLLAVVVIVLGGVQVFSQGMMGEKHEPAEYTISLYHVAPGMHMDFLKWMAAREAIAKEAGAPATKWYAHMDGASWDYMAIGKATTPEQDAKIDEMSKAKGLSTGMKASLEFRQYIATHTDTSAMGPFTAAELVEAGK